MIDLVQQSKKHILFLQILHQTGITTTKRPSTESLRRYSELWLPLVYKQHADIAPRVKLVPPTDIAWLWHCHRLAPYRYVEYVQKRFFGKSKEELAKGCFSSSTELLVLDAGFPFLVQEADERERLWENVNNMEAEEVLASAYTKEIWAKDYPDEPFFLAENDASSMKGEAVVDKNNLLDGFDVLESCERQATFLWQVSQANFSKDNFLQEGVTNYHKFVRIMGREDRPRFLVPTYQIDLIWHTHILYSIGMYHRECMNNINTILDHDDSFNDRSEGGTLDTSFKETRKFWSDVYGIDYIVKGGMYRGEPPENYFNPSWVVFTESCQAKKTLSSLPQTWLSVHSIDPKGFIAARPKDPSSGYDRNPLRKSYIFGDGERGKGYYHVYTNNAYDIVLKRISEKIKKIEKNRVVWSLCALSIILTPCALRNLDEYKDELIYLKDVYNITLARSKSYGPTSVLELETKLIKSSRTGRSANSADINFTGDYFIGPAGCGGGGGGAVINGGGGGGAGCGGAGLSDLVGSDG
jgi:hypothetical protein